MSETSISPSNQTFQLLKIFSLPRYGVAAVRKIAQETLNNNLSDIVEIFHKLFDKNGMTASDEQLLQADSASNKIIEACNSKNIKLISMLDEGYPKNLMTIKDAPPFLYVRGNLSSLRNRCIAVVGTRKASSIGLKVADRVASIVVHNNYTVVSGLALGIDTAAHKGALKSHGCTIAVMAHGLHTVAPGSNKDLADEIIAAGGALISEHPPGVPARPQEFVRRNRIQSGMSECSIVIETGEIGGTIHQARFTKEQGRELLVILPSPLPEDNDFNASGGKFIATTMGAHVIKNNQELTDYLKKRNFTPNTENSKDVGEQLGFL